MRFFTVAAFLHRLPDPAAQAAVLQRRLDFLQTPGSFFYAADGTPVSAEQQPGPFRRGILLVARATAAAERDWLTDTIAGLTRAPGS